MPAPQVAVVPVPLSPLHAAHVKVAESQRGVPPEQFVRLPDVHWRQRPAPAFADGSHTPLRQVPDVPDAFPFVHPPWPLAWPQTLSASHTPERHRFDVPPEHVPPPGMATPVAAFAWQVFPEPQNCVPVQSASTLHPPAGMHVRFEEHAPERHTVPALIVVQGPVPLAYPQRLSEVSQTPDVQIASPTGVVHVPAVCRGASLGRAVPLASFGAHVDVCPSQYCVAVGQSESSAQESMQHRAPPAVADVTVTLVASAVPLAPQAHPDGRLAQRFALGLRLPQAPPITAALPPQP